MLLSETNFFTAFSISASSVLYVLGVLTFLLGYRRLLKMEFGVTENSSVFTLRSFLLALPYFVVFPLLVPIFGYLVTAGPTAPIPSESPLVKLNRLHEGMEDNAAELYVKAFSEIKGKSPKKDDWSKNRWFPGNLMPLEAKEWVIRNDTAITTLRQATQQKNCWFELIPDDDCFPTTDEFEKMRTLSFLEYCRARLAIDDRNWRELADAVLKLDAMKRHLQQTHYFDPQLHGIAAEIQVQKVVLAPFYWPELTPWELAEYTQLIIKCFDEMPPLTETLKIDHEIALWYFISAPEQQSQKLLLIPAPRLAAELEKYAKPQWLLSELPIEDQANQHHPLHEEIRRLQREPVSKFNLVGQIAEKFRVDFCRLLEFRVRITTLTRGNRTVIALFAYRDRYGCFPESLDMIPSDFKIDPYSAKPFVYKKTDQGFLLHSVGVDRDNDGGTHHPKFGERKSLDPDGDYVIWPLPAGNIPDEDNAGRSTEP